MGIFGHKFPNVLERYSVFPQKKIEKYFLKIKKIKILSRQISSKHHLMREAH
jgi:hypothetical protein